ncbi:MFS transporter [Kitasatospora sp. NPDC048365]|uniref:MFS transporter n=1 Tax=Kitasatospora sp. NPDC048365 TaxID=3364050 RepID=UPI0037186719
MRKWIPLAAISLGAFMLLVDVSIVNVALPQMSADLDSSFTALQWVVDVYALMLAALLMALGSLGDRVGHRRLYLLGLVVFAAASLGCALAPGAGTLIAARAAQGVGGAAMMTSTTALIGAAYRGRERGVAFGVWGAVNGAAAAVGPVLGGLLTDGFGWRSIFLVNVPVAAAAVLLTRATVPAQASRAGGGRFDLAGAVLFTGFGAALVYGLIESGERGWGSPRVLVPLVGAALALAGFVLVERRAERPLLDLALLRNRSFLGLTLGGLLLTAGAFAQLTYTSLWLQQVLGLGPLGAGLVVCPLAASAFVVAPLSARLFPQAAPRRPIGYGLLLIGAGTLMLCLVGPGSGWAVLVPGLLVTGVGVGLATPSLMSSALAAVEPQRAGMAAGVVSTGRQLGFALGIAVLGTVFQDRLRDFAGAVDPHVAFAAGLDRVYLVAGCVGLAAGVLVLATVRPVVEAAAVGARSTGADSVGAGSAR